MNPSHRTSKQLLDAVWESLHKKDIRQAIHSSNLLGRNFPDFAPGWHAASHLAQLIQQPESALIAIDRALTLEPTNIDWQIQRVGCLLMSGDNKGCEKFLRTLLSSASQYAAAQLSQLAFLCSRLEFHDEAAEFYQKLIHLEPENGGHWYNLASVQRFKGRIDLAEASLDKAIKLNPEDYEAYELRSDLRKQTPDSNHINQLKETLENGVKTPAGEVRVCYALAKELEDTGDTKQSFNTLSRGAGLRRKHMNYDINDDLQTVEAIMDTFDSTLIENHKNGYQTAEPIFIIGLPRTGTTLIERILGSHSGVFAAGELNNFAVQMMQQVGRQAETHRMGRQDLVQRTAQINYEKLGSAYLESTRPATGHTQRFVDKMPLNFLYAGLIHMALPRSKIIHVVRNPADTCYAIYKRLFQDGYPWSYDLDEIAAYYLAYRCLMTHWDTVMPGVIHDLVYEDFVTDPETQTRELLNFCELPWQSQCLSFNESSTVTTTASAAQVRQPIYTTSVHRWHDYEQQLAPLVARLRQGEIQID